MLAPGAVIGILGGGQLGRMLALAAAPLGLRVRIFAPEPAAPAAEVSAAHTQAAYEDEAALARFAASVDAVTYEFENVPAAAAAFLARLKPVRPGTRALAVAQDRVDEKRFMRSAGLKTADFAPASTPDEARAAFAALGGAEVIVKTRRFGYDGKGQSRAASADAAAAALARFAVPCILERIVPFEREISVIAARGADGEIAAYEPVENQHRDGILWRSSVPARISAACTAEAQRIAAVILEGLGYVGVMGVELFAEADGVLRVNEIAPRVHNSGHWTMDACAVSQFSLHMRAVAGWPLPPLIRHSDCVMENLIGEAAAAWRELSRRPGAALHLYGKGEALPGRKMGHLNQLYPLGQRP